MKFCPIAWCSIGSVEKAVVGYVVVPIWCDDDGCETESGQIQVKCSEGSALVDEGEIGQVFVGCLRMVGFELAVTSISSG